MTAPKDPYNLVYILFYLMSIGTLLPWNFFINVSGYWMYKFRTVNNVTGEAANDANTTNLDGEGNTTDLDGETKNDLQLQFTADLAIAAQIPNVAVLILNGLFGHRFKTTPRLIVSLLIVVLMFIVTLVFAAINTDAWQSEFLVITLVTTVVINAASAVFQGGFRGIAGVFPPAYMNGVLSGMAVGGVFTAGINILLLAVGGDDVSAAFYCFIVAVFLLSLCFFAFLLVTRTSFYHFYTTHHPQTNHTDESSPLISKPDTPPSEISVLAVLRELWKTSLSILLIYVVTLGCFPALTVLIESTEKDSPSSTEWHNTYFVPVACFLFFNIGDYLGRLTASFRLPHPSPSLTLLLSSSRLAFLPLFLFCNASPSSRYLTPVLFHSDFIYMFLMLLFSVSNGYLTSVCFVAAPQAVQPHLQLTAANLMVSVLGIGLVIGSACSAALVQLL